MLPSTATSRRLSLPRKPQRPAGPRRPAVHPPSVPPGRVFVDSGAFIGLFSADDQHHDDADALFRACIRHKTILVTSQLVIAEVHRFLLFNAGIDAAAVALDKISASPALTIEYTTAEHHRSGRAWLEKLGDQVISYTDAVSFAVMVASRCDAALSFDDDFVIAGFTLLRAELPSP